MTYKKSLKLFIAAVVAVIFMCPFGVQAQFSHDFLYKFQSSWSDVAVNSTGSRIFIINESYSRLEEYNSSGILQAIYGGFGTGTDEFNRPQGLVIDATDILYILDSGNDRVVRYTTALSTTPGTALGVSTTWGSYGTSDAGTFNAPSAIATDGTNVYIADTGNNRVQKCVGTTGSCTIWGSFGTQNGAFSGPRGIAYDASLTHIYVTDTGNNRVQVFNTSGVYQTQFGSYGSTSGLFILPYRVVTESSGSHYIYVLDTTNRIQRFVQSSKAVDGTINLTSSGTGLSVNSSTLYITARPNTFQTYGTLTLTLAGTMTNDIGHPVDMSLDTDGNFYINNNFTTPNTPVIQKFNSSFIQTDEWSGSPSFAYSVGGPLGIGINTGNDLLVADTDNNTVQRFTSSGTWMYNITPYPTYGAFSKPKDVATEATNKFYVADTGNSRIVKFSANPTTDINGGFIWSQTLPTVAAGTPTPPVGSTPAPYGLTIASDNKIYVADAGYHRILRYNANDNGFETSWGAYGSDDSNPTIPQFDTPQGMAIGPEPTGYIYVADTGNNRIQRFNQSGGDKSKWGVYGTQDGNFDQPRNVAVDSASRVYVSEVGNKRIQVFGNAATSAGVTITQSNGTTISEGLTEETSVIDSYTVRLNTQPTADVAMILTVSDPAQATVTVPAFVFTKYNWNIPQTVTVVPTHDFIANGSRSVIITHKSTSSDTNYNKPSVSWSDVTVDITDTVDTTGITFSSGYIPSNIVPWATEGATLSNAYSVVLNTKPTADVTVELTPDSSLTLDSNTLTFTPETYNTPQWVQVSPTHDFVAQGQHTGIINHVAASADPNYASPNIAFSEASGNVTVTIQDIDTVGVVVSETAVSVVENGTTDTYTVKLNSKPTSDVLIYPTDASPSALVTLSPTTLTFSTSNWSTPQTVTVTAVHDYLQNAVSPRSTAIVHESTYSLDSAYSNIVIASVAATITDSDTGGLLLFRPGGGSVAVTEAGATDTYAFQLTSIPLQNVTVTITSPDTQATTSAYFYTFTPANWNTPQYATASATNDSVEEGTHTGQLLHTLQSSDANFEGKTATQTVTITDNDTAGITITLPNGAINIAEAGPSDSFFVKLNSQPSSSVVLTMSAENQATASPATLTFTTDNWATNQEVTLSAIQDYIIEGAHTATVTYTGSASDSKYSAKTASFVANIADDDSLSPGVSVVETDGGTYVSKDAVTDTYTLVLTSKPTANVKIKIVANGPEATTSAGVYWFTPTVWNVPQTVTVSAKTNPSGSKAVIFTHYITSLDPHYSDYSPSPTVNVTVAEHTSSSSSGPVAAPGCNKTPPYDAPQLYQITTTKNDATLFFSSIKENVSYYFIAYGFSPGDLRFGTSFQMGPMTGGSITYSVGMLDAGTKYYFQVRGGNGCATGPWSGSVPATTVGTTGSAQTSYTYYAPAGGTAVTGGTSSSSGGSTAGSSSPTGGIWLTRDLYPGSQGADVRSLQEHLNAHGFILASSGPGSPGNETTSYGNLTAAAVRRFQEAHFAEILSPLGYASGTGICGSSTRNYINSHP